jgi:hypothetical protein
MAQGEFVSVGCAIQYKTVSPRSHGGIGKW